MADYTQVRDALVGALAGTLYPGGTAQPSITGRPFVVYGGWPNPADLDNDLPVRRTHVNVWPTNTEKVIDTTQSDWTTLADPATTLTLTVAGQTVTVGGTVSTPQNVALVVDGRGYVYAVQPADTLTSIATALATLVALDFPGTSSSGAVVTIPKGLTLSLDFVNQVYQSANPHDAVISPRVGGFGTSQREVRRVQRTFQITVWAGRPDDRDQVNGLLDAAMNALDRLNLPDQTYGSLRYIGSRPSDGAQKEHLYRCDLLYAVEFSATETRSDAQIVITTTNVSAGPSLDAQFPIATIVE
jgi:hypothetical protein